MIESIADAILGVDPVAVLMGLNLAAFIGWTYTTYQYRKTLDMLIVAHFWWRWWVETSVRHGIEVGDDDVTAAGELMPEPSPSIRSQISMFTDEPERHIDGGD